MTTDDIIERNQPLGYTDGDSGPSVAVKEEVDSHHGNEHDQADMNRLGKKQKLDVRRKMPSGLTWNDRLTHGAQFWLTICPRSYLRPHGDMGDYVHVRIQ